MLRWLTAGESHGPRLIAVLEGLPAGVPVTRDDDPARPRPAPARLRPRVAAEVRAGRARRLGGVVHGRSIGSPIALAIGNTEWPKWEEVMNAEAVAADRRLARPRCAAHPAPARPRRPDRHAEVRLRRGAARARARERPRDRGPGRPRRRRPGLPRAARHRARQPHVVDRPCRACPRTPRAAPADVERIDADPVRCFDPETSALMVEEVDAAHHDGDTLGGVVEVVGEGLPPGLGSLRALGPQARRPARRRADGHPGDQGRRDRRRLPHRRAPRLRGARRARPDRRDGIERAHRSRRRHRGRHEHRRRAARPRGDEADLDRAARAARPSTSPPARPPSAHHQRSDVCAVPAAGVVAEAMVALVLADAVVEKFGGDSIDETSRNLEAYLAAIPAGLRTRTRSR